MAAAILAGCGAVQSTSGVVPITGNAQQIRKRSSSGTDLLYITSVPYLTIISYPAGKVVAKIPGNYSNSVLCSDPDNGNVFVLNPGEKIDEYAHGGTSPIATLTGPSGYPYLTGCAVDPKTHNLAVTSFNPGGVLIWANAQGYPTWHPSKQLPTCDAPVYDDSGNLYLNGRNKHERFRLAELRVGHSDYTVIRYPHGPWDYSVYPPNQLQWDGKYLAFEEVPYSGYGNTLYQVKVMGSTSKVVSTAHLLRSNKDRLFWLHAGLLLGFYGGEEKNGRYAVAVWHYPGGGKPLAHFYGVKNGNYGNYPELTLSIAPSGTRSRN
jgi:hypothetical protein